MVPSTSYTVVTPYYTDLPQEASLTLDSMRFRSRRIARRFISWHFWKAPPVTSLQIKTGNTAKDYKL